jgi:hypothetical protein
VNSSGTVSKSTYVQEVKEMYFLDVPLQADEAVIKADSRELGDYLALEARGAMEAATLHIGEQFYTGTTNDAKGFGGLLSQSVGKVSTGGTTNSTSAYLVWLNPQGVSFVVGNDGEFSMKPWTTQYIISGTSQKLAWVSNLSSYIGLQVGSSAAVWRVSGITTASGAGLTDARGNQLLSNVPLARRSGLRWFMNRLAAFTLQQSRTGIANVAAGSGGSPAYAAMPTELAGVPITLTDSIDNTSTNAGNADVYAAE